MSTYCLKLGIVQPYGITGAPKHAVHVSKRDHVARVHRAVLLLTSAHDCRYTYSDTVLETGRHCACLRYVRGAALMEVRGPRRVLTVETASRTTTSPCTTPPLVFDSILCVCSCLSIANPVTTCLRTVF